MFEFYFSETLSINHVPGFHLLQDHVGTNYKKPWDDFNFIITFKLYYVEDNEKRNLGTLKVLSKKFENTSTYFKENTSPKNEKIKSIKNCLTKDNVISLAEDIDFYKKLSVLFSEQEIENILMTLCDAGYYYESYSEYSHWHGFSGSFMRGSASKAILKKGFQIALGRYIPKTKLNIGISKLGDTFDDVNISFDTSRVIGKSNVNLIIGKNGTGKSHILKRLSEIIVGIVDGKDEQPYFHKLIVIAFSPFESFYTKSQVFDALSKKYSNDSIQTNKKSSSRKRLHINEYAYIGFRNDEGKHDLTHPIKQSILSLLKIIDYDNENAWWELTPRLNTVIQTLSICMDFDSIYVQDVNGDELEITSNLNTTQVKKIINFNQDIIFKKNDNVLSLSSGQKIYSYMIPAIIAELEEESLLVLDEPELYLHPELEVGLINMLQHILKSTKSFSIIATHSAILAREVERNAVTILRKSHGRTEVNIANIETYGESLDKIIAEVFDDDYIIKPYQVAINKYLNANNTIDELKRYVGDDALSYALSIAYNSDDMSVED